MSAVLPVFVRRKRYVCFFELQIIQVDFTLLPVHSRKHPLKDAQTRSSSTQLPSQVARPPATLTYFFIYVESRDIFGFLSPVILLLYFFTIPSNTSTWSCGAEVKWRLKRWATKSNRVHLKLCRGSTLTPSGHG